MSIAQRKDTRRFCGKKDVKLRSITVNQSRGAVKSTNILCYFATSRFSMALEVLFARFTSSLPLPST